MEIEQVLLEYRDGDEAKRLSLFLAYRDLRDRFEDIEQESLHDDLLLIRFPANRKQRVARAA